MSLNYTFGTLIREIALLLAALIFAVPIFVMINVAFMPTGQQTSPIAFPPHPTFSNFLYVWNEGGLGQGLLSSAFITVVSIALIVAFASPAAYALARSGTKWSRLAFYGFLLGLLIPYQLIVIPIYQTMRDLSLLSTPYSLILFYVGLQMPFSVFIYTQFLRNLPKDYEEAARLDGCSAPRTFVHVVFPMLRPVTGTIIILNGIFIWSDFFTPLLFVEGSPYQTASVAVYSFINGQNLTNWPAVFSGLIMTATPVLVIYLFMQRRFIEGFASGLKG